MPKSRTFGVALLYLLVAIIASFIFRYTWVSTLFSSQIGVLLGLALVGILAFMLSHDDPPVLHIFIWAFLFGAALSVPLSTLTHASGAFRSAIDLLAAFMLFGSGLLVPVKQCKKHFAPIAVLSFVGTLLTVVLFAYALSILTAYFGILLPVFSLIILAAILAAVDPTALLPSLEQLHPKHAFLKDVARSEGALDDVVGVILTRFFLVVTVGTESLYHLSGVGEGFASLITRASLELFSLEVLWGSLVGLLGYFILKVWGESVRTFHWSDPALFMVVPMFSFALGSIVGSGAGFLAAFVAGVLYESHAKTHEVRAFFDRFAGTLLKPAVFILLGAVVSLEAMVNFFPVGLAAALVFMLVIRPLVVAISLLPWLRKKTGYIGWRDALLLSTLRQTGAIPAMLLLTLTSYEVVGGIVIYAIGAWVIILTLIIEPPLAQALAHYTNRTTT